MIVSPSGGIEPIIEDEGIRGRTMDNVEDVEDSRDSDSGVGYGQVLIARGGGMGCQQVNGG